MDERSKQTSTLPDLHKLLNHSSMLNHNFLWNNVQNNPSFFAHKISFQRSSDSPLPASSEGAPNTTHSNPPRKQNRVSMSVELFRFASQVAALIATAPLERVSILMQCQTEMIKHGHLSSPYKGMRDCFTRTIKHEGVLTLWRGYSLSVIGGLTTSLTRTFVLPFTPPLWHIPLIVSKSGFFHPLQYARVRLATDVKDARKIYFSLDSAKSSFSNNNDGFGSRKFSGASDVLCKTLKSDGLFGLYRGFLPGCLAVAGSYLSLQWGRSVAMQNKEEKLREIFIPVAATTIFGMVVLTYPFVTVSRRMMMSSGEKTRYNGMVDTIGQMVKYEGVFSLYKGLTPHLLRFFIVLSTTMYASNLARKLQK